VGGGSVDGVGDVGVVEELEFLLSFFLEEELKAEEEGETESGNRMMKEAKKREWETHRLVRLLPNSNRPIVRSRNDELPLSTNSQSPDLSMVTVHLLDHLELRQ